MDLKSKIRVIEDYPKEGISFKDISTLVKEPKYFKSAVDEMVESLKDLDFGYIVAPEARGFIFGSVVAYLMDKGLVMIRKVGKLPGEKHSIDYELEYGTNTLEVHKNAIEKGSKIVIIDDLLATGGTINAVVDLFEMEFNAEIVAMEFLVELTSLEARNLLKDYRINSLIKYEI